MKLNVFHPRIVLRLQLKVLGNKWTKFEMKFLSSISPRIEAWIVILIITVVCAVYVASTLLIVLLGVVIMITVSQGQFIRYHQQTKVYAFVEAILSFIIKTIIKKTSTTVFKQKTLHVSQVLFQWKNITE